MSFTDGSQGMSDKDVVTYFLRHLAVTSANVYNVAHKGARERKHKDRDY